MVDDNTNYDTANYNEDPLNNWFPDFKIHEKSWNLSAKHPIFGSLGAKLAAKFYFKNQPTYNIHCESRWIYSEWVYIYIEWRHSPKSPHTT